MGRAPAVTYDGDADGLAQYVEVECGHVAGENPLAPLIASGYVQMEAVNVAARPITPQPSEAEEIVKAEAAVDWGGELGSSKPSRWQG